VRKSAVSWDRKQRRFSWKRYGFVKEVQAKTGGQTAWVEIPWPSEEVEASSPSKPTKPTRSSYPATHR